MPVHHVGLHLLGVRQHVRPAGRRIGPGPSNGVPDPARGLLRIDHAPAGQDGAERNRQPGVGLPPLAQVDQGGEAVSRIGEPGLVDHQSGVVAAAATPGMISWNGTTSIRCGVRPADHSLNSRYAVVRSPGTATVAPVRSSRSGRRHGRRG